MSRKSSRQAPRRPAVKRSTVSGNVRLTGGLPAPGIRIVALDRDLRTEQPLGSARTDAAGGYRISYSPQASAKGETGKADVLVRALAEDGATLAQSTVRFNARPEEVIDLIVPLAQKSEWERLTLAVAPLLEGQNVLPDAFTEADIEFIVADAGVDRDLLRAWAWGYRAAVTQPLLAASSSAGSRRKSDTKAARSSSAGRSLEERTSGSRLTDWLFYYACARNPLPQNTGEILKRRTEDLLAAAQRAISANQVPASFQQSLKALAPAIDRARVDLHLQPTPAGEPARLGDILDTVSRDWLDRDKRRALADVVARVDVDEPDFQQEVQKIGVDTKDLVLITRSLRLAKIADGHLPAMAALQPLLENDDDATLSVLTAVEPGRWFDIAFEHGTPRELAGTPELFATRMRDAVERAAPEAALRAQLTAGSLGLAGAGFASVGRFLVNNTDFSFARHDVESFVAEANLKGIEEPAADLTSALSQLQSLQRAGVRWNEAPVFIDAGATSIERLAEYGSAGLRNLVGAQLDTQRVAEVAQNAKLMKAAGIGLVGQLLPLLRGTSTQMMQPRMLDTVSRQYVDSSPSLRRLFGSLEQCACDPCQSVLSPAAYFADLLKFVARDNGVSWHLYQRRADLYDLELSCDNAQIELPHIDLVNEILENAIALPYAISLPGVADIVAALRQHPYPAALVAALQKTTWDPLVESSLQAEVSSNARMGTTYAVITDRYRRWGLEVRAGYFGIIGSGVNAKLEIGAADIERLVAALDKGELSSSVAADYFSKRALGTSLLPADVTDLDVQVIQRGRRWRVTTTVKGRAEVDEGKRQIRYSSKHRSVSRKYATNTLRGTRRALDANRIGGVLLAEASDASNYVISRAAPDAWIYSKTVTYDFVYVAAGVVIQSLSYQCTARDRDLYVRPQHRNPRAYRDFLAQTSTVFPWTLPYDIDLAETRSLLRAAGLERGTLMRAALPAADAARRAALAIEQLGMTRSELTLATAAATTDAEVWKRFGLEVTGGAATLFDSYAEVERTDAPLTLLSTVSILLQQARLKFVELEWLLQSQFINPGLATSIQSPSDAVAGADCDPTRLVLNPCSGALLDRLHRFVRWQRRLKWSMPQLDFALRKLTALPNSTAETVATALADIESLRARLGISVETLLTGLYGFDRVSYRERKGGSINVIDPLYERTFQNPRTARAGAGTAATRAPDPQLAYASVSGGALTITLGDYASTLAACVGLHAHEVLLLLNAEYAVTPAAVAVDATTRVTLDHLLRLLRDAFLARALRISPTRLATVIDLQNRAPFDSPRALLDFCDDVEFVTRTSIDFDQLRYVLTHGGPQSFAWVFTADRAIRILQSLQTALRGADTQPVGTSASDALTAGRLETLLAHNSTQPQRLALLATLTQLGTYEVSRVVASLWPNFNDAFASEPRVRELVDVAVSWQRRAALVAANLGQLIGMDAPLTADLLWFHLRAAGNAAAMELFADPKPRAPAQAFEDASRVFDNPTVAQTPEFSLLSKLHKIGLLNGTWRLTRTELARFPRPSAGSKTLLGLALDSIPTARASGRFVEWKRSAALLKLSRSASGLSTVIDDYTAAIAPPEADPLQAGAAIIAAALDLPVTSVRAFAGTDLLAFDVTQAQPALQEWRDPLRIVAWYELVMLARRYALGASEVKLLIAETPGRDAIDVAVRALQGRFGEPQWRDVMVKAASALRSEQRDRLVDYLLWRDGLRDADALYERYLIDVQMGSCMNTTRLLQATAAVQIYVQRCLMNLEDGVDPATVDPDQQWEWRKSYRVWEANRKVFLFPENWLYPELRDDKSEVYRAYESALTQAEASDANALNAVQGYLEGLNDVAQISIMGMYDETPRQDSSGRPHKTLHVVGRSPDPPYSYFYRTDQQHGEPGNRWTPWERVSLDLPAAHVVPFVLGGALHLVWPIIELEQDSSNNTEYYNIHLAWSRRSSLGWTQRKVAMETATRIEKHLSRDERGSVALRLSENQSGPRIATVELYVARKTPNEINEADLAANTVVGTYEDGPQTGASVSDWTFSATAYVKYRETGRIVRLSGAQFFVVGLSETSTSYTSSAYQGTYFFGAYAGNDVVQSPATAPGFAADGTAYPLEVHNDDCSVMIKGVAIIEGVSQSVTTTNIYAARVGVYQRGTGHVSANLLFSAALDPDFDDPEIDPHARVKMDLEGRFVLEAGRDTRWVPNNAPVSLDLPGETLSWESRLRERDSATPSLTAGLHPGSATIFDRSRAQSNYLSLRASRGAPDGSETWYWEESASGTTSRFFELLGAGNSSALITVQPAGFEDAREYRYRYTNGREQLFIPEAQDVPGNQRFGVDDVSSYLTTLPPGVDPRTVPLLQFHLGMPYASYNWEVFYHVPMAAARFLASQQRFEEAQRWLRCVFDPTSNDSSTGRERYWRCLPLRHSNTPLSIQQLMQALADPNAAPGVKQIVQDQVAAWETTPFSPFAVARARTSAYEWYAVMAYVKNLIEWGDSLFRRDTRESINEAAQLYVFASKILGRRPELVPKQGFQPGPLSFRALAGRMDEFSNAWVRLIDTPLGQVLLAWLLALQKIGGYNPNAWNQQLEQLASVGALYFCVPQNDALLELWDRVSDRLAKIRHCQNIEGVERPLALLDPPIDPELLIRARLAGVDIADVLADLYSPPPIYRYTVLSQKALEFCAQLESLGAALLAALEKKDNEALTLLRSSQEITMLGLVETVRLEQVAEADANIVALQQSRQNVLSRYRYLQRMLGNNDIQLDSQGVPVMDQHGTLQVRDTAAPGDFRGLGLVQSEVDQISRMQDAHVASMISAALKAASAIGRSAAAALSAYGMLSQPAADAADHIAQGLFDVAEVSGIVAMDADQASRRASLIATFQRRREDWIQQSSVAVDEIRQLDKQIAAANIRKAITQKELAHHRQSMEHARALDDYMRQRKFTTAELHGWMETQLLTTYHGAYQLAFDLAKRVERAWRRELGETESQWIRFGYWDGARKGLQAGEQLHLDLNRMQMAYLERNKREYEVTKHVSLLSLDPSALVMLRETGRCRIDVPEAVFDVDFPGHYFRRLKTVSLSIPCVVGPYGGVPATLKLLKSSVRVKTSVTEGYARIEDDTRFLDSIGGVESVVTSSGQNDSGLFETNLRDERFLPFEGAGAISTWEVTLPDRFRGFDYGTISDVLLHIRYTAREGGEDLRTNAADSLQTALNGIVRMSQERGLTRIFSLRQDFPSEWYRLRNPTDPEADSIVDITISRRSFPFLFGSERVDVTMSAVDVYAAAAADVEDPEFPEFLRVFAPGEEEALEWSGTTTLGALQGKSADVTVSVSATDSSAVWRIQIPSDDVATFKEETVDLLLVCEYAIS